MHPSDTSRSLSKGRSMNARTLRFSPTRHLLATAALALASFTTLVASAPALAQPAGMGPGMHGGMHAGMHGGGGMGHGMGLPLHPGHLDRMLDSVGASAEQKAQIRTVLGNLRSDMKAQRESGKALHEQAAQVFSAPNVDARAAEALRQQMLARHDAASKRTMQAMLDVSRVLTPEQRSKMFEQMKQRRAMAERHRAERDSLDGGAPRR
jgi:Spy/CpxP family protein refolding chaperone